MILVSFCKDTEEIWAVVGYVINFLKIAIPIIIILLATIDLGKAVMAGKEDEIKSAQKMLLKRIIYGVAIFFVTTIVQLAFSLVGQNVKGDKGSAHCFSCISDPEPCRMK